MGNLEALVIGVALGSVVDILFLLFQHLRHRDRSVARREKPHEQSEADSMKPNQIVLLVIRLIGGITALVLGVALYPLGTPKAPDQAVPIALVVVGSIVALQSLLDLIWTVATTKDGQAGKDGTASVVGVFVAAIATVLGLITAFQSSPTYAVRLGTLVLVIGLILGLLILGYVAYGVAGPATGSMIAWLYTVLFAATGFGLACLGLSVFYQTGSS